MDPDASIILVGVRGAGKKTLGLIAATALNWRFVTEDLYFERTVKQTKASYVDIHGQQAFYKENVDAIRSMLSSHRQRCVIECGWAALTSEIHQLLQDLCKTNPVIHVTRSLKEIQSLLQLDELQTSLFRRADDCYRECSNYEFYNIQDFSHQTTEEDAQSSTMSPAFRLKDAKTQFCSFLDLIRKDVSHPLSTQINRPLSRIALVERKFTHVVPVLSSSFSAKVSHLDDIEFIEDAVELEIDDFSTRTVQAIGQNVAAIRRHFGVPILYGLPHSSKERDLCDHRTYVELTQILRHGLLLGVDFLVIDLKWSPVEIRKLLADKRSTKILGHGEIVWGANSSLDKGVDMYRKAAALGLDIVRIVYVQGSDPVDPQIYDQCLATLRDSATSFSESRPALITYGRGFSSCISGQISNEILTPVHNPQLCGWGAEKEYRLSAKQAMQIRFQQGLLDPLRLYLIGSVSLNVAPAMFKAALNALGLEFEYRSRDTISEEGLDELAHDEHFGGASITYGFKTIVAPYVDESSQHAMAIGAVNTLLPLRRSRREAQPILVDRDQAGPISSWYGDNTDWIGMTVCIQRNLSPRNAIQPNKTTGLVVGRGGMARAAIYSMLRLGVAHVLVYDPSTGQQNSLPEHFNVWLKSQSRDNQTVAPLSSPHDPWPANIEQPTIVISCPSSRRSPAAVSHDKVPLQWAQSKTGGVVLEMAYKPLVSPLLQQFQNLRASTGQPWVTVNGIDMLTEQGSVQFELLTGRRAPRQAMRAEARRAYVSQEL